MGIEQIEQRLRDVHDKCRDHRTSVLASTECGCFCCCSKFPPTQIKEWVRDEGTAICPNCGIDSVLGNKDVSITEELLVEMREAWFAPHPDDLVVSCSSNVGSDNQQ